MNSTNDDDFIPLDQRDTRYLRNAVILCAAPWVAFVAWALWRAVQS